MPPMRVAGRRSWLPYSWIVGLVERLGFLKIVAKHGWGATALAKTQAALLTVPAHADKYDRYTLENTPGLPNPACDWVVVVQRDANEVPWNPEQTQSAPMNHIITAHGTPHAP